MTSRKQPLKVGGNNTRILHMVADSGNSVDTHDFWDLVRDLLPNKAGGTYGQTVTRLLEEGLLARHFQVTPEGMRALQESVDEAQLSFKFTFNQPRRKPPKVVQPKRVHKVDVLEPRRKAKPLALTEELLSKNRLW